MRGNFFFFFLSLLAFLKSGVVVVVGDISISNFGYRDLVVSISPDVPADNAQAVVDGIQVNFVKKLNAESFLSIQNGLFSAVLFLRSATPSIYQN